MPCMAHKLQLSVNHALKECGIDRVLSKCRKIVGHFKHSSVRTAALKDYQADKPQRLVLLFFN